ncbi:SGNH/GDSL hydrolase family protein [Gordonia sp. L191]|uniref:SGNH/GDSL hydrolase family protein n=1 Tax=Gordonia sp. L191 TaxID=2982699 RepID=UPI0024BFC405|nr:SGNH/GDSL hydrolase family protein [Gordonia sp. L191]WHU48466.1 SGNH/GDSL hydrolase family protein [Gordonia sp. L191]
MRYVAVGDSFTEGVGDEPDGPDTPRGWADLVAERLAAAHGGIDYANLAVRGRLLEPIVTDQVDAALRLDPLPTLITLNGGGNDMLRTGDLTGLVELTRSAVRRCRDAGIRVVLLAGADPSDGLPFGSTIRRRGEYLTNEVATIAVTEDVEFIDVFHDTEIRRPEYWSPDRLHLNAIGHSRAAALILRGLGVPTTTPARPESQPRPPRLVAEAGFAREHLFPWVMRRLRKQSSGDDRPAKYPDWVSVDPAGIG